MQKSTIIEFNTSFREIGDYDCIHEMWKMYRVLCYKKKTTTLISSVFNLGRSPFLKTHTLSNVAYIEETIPGTPFCLDNEQLLIAFSWISSMSWEKKSQEARYVKYGHCRALNLMSGPKSCVEWAGVLSCRCCQNECNSAFSEEQHPTNAAKHYDSTPYLLAD